MFTFADRDSNIKQTASFVASLGIQSAALIILCSLPYSQMSEPSIRHTAAASKSVTPIYFQKEAVASAPETADPAPEPPAKIKPVAEQASNTGDEAATDSEAGNDSGNEEGQGLVPFPSWRMNSAPTSDVVLEVVINDQGSIAQVTVLQAVGNGVEEEIVQTLRRWIFVPAKVNGYAIASRRQLRFHFPG